MAKSHKIGAQIYGYSVCLVSVISFLIAVASLVNSMIDLRDPLHSGWNPVGSPSLASFENYKMDVLKSSPKNEGAAIAYMPSDQTLRAMYEAAKSDKIQSVRHQADRAFTLGGIMILICGVLFFTHWRWMQRLDGPVVIQESNLSYAD
ncbi:MAG: hypothetical protein HYR67_07785 [Bacteroidetes bacterium]|nr:hypothetical protein [Bacteroidota bacterium]